MTHQGKAQHGPEQLDAVQKLYGKCLSLTERFGEDEGQVLLRKIFQAYQAQSSAVKNC